MGIPSGTYITTEFPFDNGSTQTTSMLIYAESTLSVSVSVSS